MDIRIDDLKGPEIAALLEVHLADATRHSPPGSVHALDLEALRAPDIKLWTAWNGSELMGCGALKDLGASNGEIKSMHTAAAHRGKGVARTLLETIINAARQENFNRLYLETGSMEALAPARALYTKYGFETCPPFGSYVEEPFSTHMILTLTP